MWALAARFVEWSALGDGLRLDGLEHADVAQVGQLSDGLAGDGGLVGKQDLGAGSARHDLVGKLAFARPSSRHPGGVLAVFASGRSTFLDANIDYRVYTYLMTSDSGQLKRPGFDEPLQWHGTPAEGEP